MAIFHNLRLLARMNKPNYVEPAVGWNCEDNHVGVIKYGVADYEPRKNSTPISAPNRPALLQPWPEDEPLQLSTGTRAYTRAAGQPRYTEHCSKRHWVLGSLAVSSSSWLARARQAGRRAAHTAQARARARSAGKPGKQAHTAQARKLTFVLCSVECWKRFLRSWIMPPQFLESHDACPRLFCLSE